MIEIFKKVTAPFLRVTLTDGLAQILNAFLIAAAGITALTTPDWRAAAISFGTASLIAMIFFFAKRNYERRHDQVVVRKYLAHMDIQDRGQKVTFEAKFKVTARIDNVTHMRFRFAWSGTSDLSSVLTPDCSRTYVLIDRTADFSGPTVPAYKVFDIAFARPMNKRERAEVSLKFDMQEATNGFQPFMAFGSGQYSYSLFATLAWKVTKSSDCMFKVNQVEGLEYADHTDIELKRRGAVRVWGARSILDGEVISWKVHSPTQGRVYRLEFPIAFTAP